jgi:hypothetical protein
MQWTRAKAHLTDELFVRGWIVLRTEGLLDEGQQDGDDHARFQAFSQTDEEDWWGGE